MVLLQDVSGQDLKINDWQSALPSMAMTAAWGCSLCWMRLGVISAAHCYSDTIVLSSAA